MSLALIGIIFVQGYWIKTAVNDKEEQFSYSAKQVLIDVSKELQNQELLNFWFEFEKGDNSTIDLTETSLMDYFQLDKNRNSNSESLTGEGILQEDDKISSDFLISAQDSIQFSTLINKKVTDIFKRNNIRENQLTSEQRLERLMRMKEVEKDMLRSYISEYTSRIPIHKRLSEDNIKTLLTHELKNYNLKTNFEFGIFSNSLATKIHSSDFSLDFPATYSVPLFVDSAGSSNYQLLVNFTEKKKVVLSLSLILI